MDIYSWFTWIVTEERRKVERRIRRLEKQQRTSPGQAQDMEIAEQLSKLKEDLEYVRVKLVAYLFLFEFAFLLMKIRWEECTMFLELFVFA